MQAQVTLSLNLRQTGGGNEEELLGFEKRLKDRFENFPPETENLFTLVRLRWVAIRIGFERLTLKNERMIGYFISSDNSPYYQSSAFGKVLYYVQHHAVRTKLRETVDKRSIIFSDVKTVKTAYDILRRIDEE